MTTTDFYSRMNQTPDRLLSDALLHNDGIGNEIGFYIFDYPPEEELEIRRWMPALKEQLNRQRPDVRVVSVNLFAMLVSYLKDRDLYGSACEMQLDDGGDDLLEALQGPLDEKHMMDFFRSKVMPEAPDLILLHGVGAAWPLVRTHSLLNNLQAVVGRTPLVLFYPGTYDSAGLRLFDALPSVNYYRAFRLIP